MLRDRVCPNTRRYAPGSTRSRLHRSAERGSFERRVQLPCPHLRLGQGDARVAQHEDARGGRKRCEGGQLAHNRARELECLDVWVHVLEHEHRKRFWDARQGEMEEAREEGGAGAGVGMVDTGQGVSDVEAALVAHALPDSCERVGEGEVCDLRGEAPAANVLEDIVVVPIGTQE